MFKPPFKIRDKKGLLKLLKQADLKGLGGILLEDVQESLPNHEKILKVSIVLSSRSKGSLIDKFFCRLLTKTSFI